MKTPSVLIKYFRRKRNQGIATVYIALLLVALLAFVGLAIDIGYMYVAKTQLQNAADAASLAGAAVLVENTKTINQPLAREEAWKIACQNKVVPGNTPVFLIASAENCASPPSDLNNTNNDPYGDIVLGNWNDTTGFTPGVSNNNTLFINAVKVVARRTSETSISNVKIGNNPVSLFFGKILSLLPGGGKGWGTMNAASSAIAVRNSPPVTNLTLCLPDCGQITPLSISDPDNNTPGLRYYTKGTITPLIGWTTFFDVDTSVTNLNNYLNGTKQIPDLCPNYPTKCLNTTNGVDNPIMCTLKGIVNEQSSNYTINGVTIHGFKTFIPIVDSVTNPCSHKGTACINDPTYQPGDAFPFIKYAEVIITDSVPQGNCPKVSGQLAGGKPGVVLVGTGAGSTGFSYIRCIECNEIEGEFISSARLVK